MQYVTLCKKNWKFILCAFCSDSSCALP